jgi:hypothetical protein
LNAGVALALKVSGEGSDEQVLTSEPEASLWLQLKARLLGGFVPEGWL